MGRAIAAAMDAGTRNAWLRRNWAGRDGSAPDCSTAKYGDARRRTFAGFNSANLQPCDSGSPLTDRYPASDNGSYVNFPRSLRFTCLRDRVSEWVYSTTFLLKLVVEEGVKRLAARSKFVGGLIDHHRRPRMTVLKESLLPGRSSTGLSVEYAITNVN